MISLSLLLLVLMATLMELSSSANILMVTMGGTKSHKIPFWALAKGLTARGHNITFISAFPSDFGILGMEEITPTGLVFYVRNFTDWDLVGARMRGEEPVHPLDMLRYGYEACDALLSDSETQEFLYSKQKFDLIVLDGAYPECALGFVYFFNAPFMYINTVGFYTGSLSIAGNPTPYSVTPFLARPFTDSMNLLQRTSNAVWHLTAQAMHMYMVKYYMQRTLRRYFGPEVPPIYDMSRNVSFILQNAYATVTYPRPYLPNVAEIACIHCKPPKPLPKDLEKFVSGSDDAGFIYISMGSSVRTANMPEYLRRMLLRVFRELPQRVLWKWEADDDMPDLPANVKLRRWLPQQDLLGHKKIRAFITHGGLLSMFETVYHGVPIVSLPVFCDHDSNAAKAEVDGYAVKLDFSSLTAEKLLGAINKIIYDPKYKEEVKRRQVLLRDQKETPLERSIFWTEYVLRHRGAKHLQSPARNMNVIEYYMIDVVCLLVLCAILMWYLLKIFAKIMYRIFATGSCGLRMYDKVIKIE